MKTRKNSKILILVLSLALLIGSVFAITASAAEAETGDLYAVNVYHNDKLAVMFAVKATQAEIQNGTVQVKYTWNDADPTEEVATYLEAHPTKAGYVYVVTTGVAAFALTDTVDFTVYTNGVAGDSGTYSVATYLYNKLYRDAVTGAEKDVYETLVAYGAASQVYFEYNTENMIDAVDYAYTKNSDVKFNGKSYSIGQSTVTATYNGTGIVGAWIINGEEIASSATTYEVTVDGVVSVDVKVTCDHTDANPKDHECDYCGTEMGGACADGNKDHNCDYCGAELSTCADGNNDHNCDVCGTKLSDCVDAGKDHACDICGGNVGGECADGNNDHNCDYCGDKLTDHTDANKDHDCDVCGAENVTECVDENKDHVCDICGEAGAPCADGDGDYRCDACGKYSFNTNMTSGQNGVSISQTQSNNVKPSSSANILHSTTITDAERNAAYHIGTYYSIVTDPTNASNKVLSICLENRNTGGTNYLNNKIRFTPTGAGDLTVFDFDLYFDGNNAPVGNDMLVVYLLDDSAYKGNWETGTGEGSSGNCGYQKIIFTNTEEGHVKFAGTTSDAVVNQWFSVRVVVDAYTETYHIYYSLDGGLTYKALSTNRTSTTLDITKLSSVAFGTNTYGDGNNVLKHQEYVDNVDCYRLNCFDFELNKGTASFCTNVDANTDHVCDSCGKTTVCEDTNGDNKCEVCGVYSFDSTITEGQNGFVVNNWSLAASSASQQTLSTIDSTTARENDYGSFMTLAADPKNAANSVLKVVTKATGSADNYRSNFAVAPTVVDDGGNYVVFEFDYYVDNITVSTYKAILEFVVGNDDSKFTTSSCTYYTAVYKGTGTSGEIFRAGNADQGTCTFSNGEWVRIRLVYSYSEHSFTTYFSADKGATWELGKTKACTAGVAADYFGLRFPVYQIGATHCVDNMRCDRVAAVSMTMTDGSTTDFQ